MRGWLGYWLVLQDAYHALGAYDRELAAAREARRRFPDDPALLVYEARAKAVVGRLDSADSVLDAIEGLAQSADGDVMVWLGDELAAHGDSARALAVYVRALHWFDARPATGRAGVPFRAGRGRVLYRLARWKEARAIFLLLSADHQSGRAYPPQENIEYLGYVGSVAARLGDSSSAARADSALGAWRRPGFGDGLYWRARITTLLGDRERAVSLLRDAIGRGLSDAPPMRRHLSRILGETINGCARQHGRTRWSSVMSDHGELALRISPITGPDP